MSYLNTNYSCKYNTLQKSDEQTQAQYLTNKVLQIHNKLMKEYEYSAKLQQKIGDWQQRYMATMADNQNLVKKCGNLSAKYDKQKSNSDKVKLLELHLVQAQKKNDLLRIDLESMRTKMLELASYKQNIQEINSKLESTNQKLNEKVQNLHHDLKLKETSIANLTQEIERFTQRCNKQIQINQGIQRELQTTKMGMNQLIHKSKQIENTMRQQRERNGKNMNQMLAVQSELRGYKQKNESLSQQLRRIKQENHSLKMKGRQEEKNIAFELQKLILDYKHLQAQYRQKELQLEEVKNLPSQHIAKSKANFQHTKELLNKLDRQQKARIAERNSPSSRNRQISPHISFKNYQPRSYKEEKQQKLSIIQKVGTMQSQMLNCNMQRKKMQAQIDKIDEARVKTKQMISRRRRLQVEHQNLEKQLESIKNQLKKLKVI